MIIMMETYEDSSYFIKSKKEIKTLAKNKKDPILCKHCMRTVSNGIRCMGICVADNEY